MKVAYQMAVNIAWTSVPLFFTEPIMKMLMPHLKERPRLKNYDPSTYKNVEWEKIDVTRKRDLLRKAKLEQKNTGKFSVKVDATA
jgi:hypothetical protein